MIELVDAVVGYSAQSMKSLARRRPPRIGTRAGTRPRCTPMTGIEHHREGRHREQPSEHFMTSRQQRPQSTAQLRKLRSNVVGEQHLIGAGDRCNYAKAILA